MLKKYVKGDVDNIVSRIKQVSDITINVPTDEKCMDYLYDCLMILCNHYSDDSGDSFSQIPAIDFYNVVLFTNRYCNENNVNTECILAMSSIIRTFENLKHISVVFKDDDGLRESYEKLITVDSDDTINDIIGELTNVYSIDVIDMYLGDMFDQDIVDLLNKHLMSNEIIPNSYLEREFKIMFEFEEYVSYINMFIDNNIERLSMYDNDIMDYLRVFPSIICDVSKPDIRLYTNYREI